MLTYIEMLISGELIVLCKPNFTKKERKRRVTLAFASHLLSPTMSDSEIGGEPAIIYHGCSSGLYFHLVKY